MRIFDARTGYLLRTVRTGGALAVDDRTGRVFVASIDGDCVTMLGQDNPHIVLRTVASGVLPYDLAVDERRERVVVVSPGTVSAGAATSPGQVSILDARSGAILSSAAAGWGPIAVAVDERTGHVFVANAGGVMRVPDFWGWVPPCVRRGLPFLPRPWFRTRLVPGSVSVIDTTR